MEASKKAAFHRADAEKFLAEKRGANRRFTWHTSVFHFPFRGGELLALKWLHLKTMWKVTDVDTAGRNVAHFAALIGRLDVLQWLHSLRLLSKSAMSAEAQEGYTIAHFAATRGDLRILRWLFSTGMLSICDVRLKSSVYTEGMSVSHCAAQTGHLDVLQYLHELGLLEPELRNSRGRSVALVAAQSCHLDVLKWLHSVVGVVDGREVDDRGCTMTHCVVWWEDLMKTPENCPPAILGILTWLHSQNLLDERKNAYGWNIAHFAARYGLTHMLEWVSKESALEPDDAGWTIAHYAAWAGRLKVLQWMHAKQWLQVDERDYAGYNVAHFCARAGRLSLLKWLHSTRLLNPNAKSDDDGCNIAHLAAKEGRLDILKWLRSKKILNREERNNNGDDIDDIVSRDLTCSATLPVYWWLREIGK